MFLKFAEYHYTECHTAEGVMRLLNHIEELDPEVFSPSFDMIKFCRRKTTGIVEFGVQSDKHCTIVNVFDGKCKLRHGN